MLFHAGYIGESLAGFLRHRLITASFVRVIEQAHATKGLLYRLVICIRRNLQHVIMLLHRVVRPVSLSLQGRRERLKGRTRDGSPSWLGKEG
mmetsp:Transcript_13367/g.21417  ORF Transcript_13367/g.21417 Transcript_13367/m.21417 type:complete len:92 (-) Transcript_13367:55-330(-)